MRSPNVERNYNWKITLLEGEVTGWQVLTLAVEIANERRGNHPIEHHEILVKCYKNFVFPWSARKKKDKFCPSRNSPTDSIDPL